MHATALDGPSCTCSSVGDDAIVLFLFSDFGRTLGLCLRVLIRSFSISIVKIVLLCKILIFYFLVCGLIVVCVHQL